MQYASSFYYILCIFVCLKYNNLLVAHSSPIYTIYIVFINVTV